MSGGLEFENQIFVEVLSEDGLVILARQVVQCLTNIIIITSNITQGAGLGQTLSQVPKIVL